MPDPDRLPLIGPEPQYPTPWRVAEPRYGSPDEVVVTASGGHQALSADPRLAEFLTKLVNWFVRTGQTEEGLDEDLRRMDAEDAAERKRLGR
jgi:hypothetical protein